MRPEDCLFRRDVVVAPPSETACCLLAADLAGVDRARAVRVDRAACEACVDFDLAATLARHPVLPSLLLQQTDSVESPGMSSEAADERRERWRQWSESWLVAGGASLSSREALPACDVLLVADRWLPTLAAAIDSVLNQRDVVVWLHLVDASDSQSSVGEPTPATGPACVFEHYADRWNVKLHRTPLGGSPLEFAARHIRLLASSYLALQSPHGVSDARRLRFALESLEREGAELAIAAVELAGRQQAAMDDETRRPNEAAGATLVVRRATLVDVGLADPAALTTGMRFVQQALDDQRELFEDERTRVRLDDPQSVRAFQEEAARSAERARSAPGCRQTPALFPPLPFACDVVLPFHGHLDFVAEALEGLLEQSGAECVIHLIDDASPEPCDDFLAKCRRINRVRTYRNRQNIGQFQSFNQASDYFETEWAVVHDADDVSLPHRLQRTGQLLQYADADFFGGGVEVFGESTPDVRSGRTPLRRYSRYPREVGLWYYAENPTAAFRASFFRQLGGFADFGDRLLNRASVDTEFQVRSRFCHARFAMTRDVVLRYRVHGNSATQNAATGWGTAARTRAAALVEARHAVLARGTADPRSFGSLGRTPRVLERI
ncbi:MAG: glycosyltransferase family 2 protein [Pirellulales bacterium]